MANTDFYDKLDLRYPEIGIAIDRIDRVNPGFIRFIIPILTPDLPKDKEFKQKKVQTPSNLLNDNKSAVGIDSIEVSNYVKIKIPKEVVALVDGDFWIKGWIDWEGNSDIKFNGEMTHSGRTDIAGRIEGYGTVGPPMTYSSLDVGSDPPATIKGKFTNTGDHDGTEHTDGKGYYDITNGIVNLVPTDPYRYIEPNSKWIIVFIGGDITKPMVIAPYTGD